MKVCYKCFYLHNRPSLGCKVTILFFWFLFEWDCLMKIVPWVWWKLICSTPKPFDCFYKKCDLKNYLLDETFGSFEIYHQLALAQMTLTPSLIMGWRVRLWVQGSWAVYSLPIKKLKYSFPTKFSFSISFFANICTLSDKALVYLAPPLLVLSMCLVLILLNAVCIVY